jgi:NADH-quinone oxidoreductase subunit A
VSPTIESVAQNWSFAVYLLGVVGLCAFMLVASWLLGGRDWGRAKHEPFESGVVSVGTARMRLSAKFYLVAMLFVIFDVETVFMFPWAVIFDKLLLFGLIEMVVFIFILVVGYYYAWQKGALEWV